jgi:hypothetical protein
MDGIMPILAARFQNEDFFKTFPEAVLYSLY